MQDLENRPPSPSKRPGASANIDNGYKNKPQPASPPRTPLKQTARSGKGNSTVANRALRIRTGPRETFLDDLTPVDNARDHEIDNPRGNRDSHDLSLSPRQVTRDSLVDHMLLSLDQFSYLNQSGGGFGLPPPTDDEAQLYSAFGDEQPYSTFSANNGRRPQHGHSYSSDYEGYDATNRSSSQMTRGRRSNSSSNFQAGLRKNNSGIGLSERPQIPPRTLHSRGGKGSKGSSANSLDLGYAQVTGQQRWGHQIGGRSSSFDYGHDRQTSSNSQMAYQMSNDRPFSPWDDAAPTPTVPVGPRRQAPPPPSPFAQEISQPKPKPVERKRSTKSSKSVYNGPNDGGLGINFNENNRDLPPLPAFMKEQPAPAPLVGYGKSKNPVTHHTQGASVQQPKDRPGFLRRMFGSSKNNHASASESEGSRHGSTASVETTERPATKPTHIASQMKVPSLPPSRDAPPPTREQPHVLTKKPSSFFRRRKKSISEPEPPVPQVPQAPTVIPHEVPVDHEFELKLVPSPVSSLRKVMNPYLKSPIKTMMDQNQSLDGQVDQDDLEQEPRSFSPGYDPAKNATIRAIKSGSKDAPLPRGDIPRSVDRDSPTSRIPNNSTPQARGQRDGTFLQDSSDNDQSTMSRSPDASKEVPGKRVHDHVQPLQVARDMALVAEYERVHSKRSPKSPTVPQADKASKSSLASPASSKPPKSPSKGPPTPDKDDWIVVPKNKSPVVKDKENRVWLEPTSSEEDLAPAPGSNLSLPLEGARASARTSSSNDTVYKSATSLVIPSIEEPIPSPALNVTADTSKSIEEPLPSVSVDEPTVGDRERAQKIYDGNEDFIQKSKAAAWLGDEGVVRHRTLLAYMELYDFANLNILAALRILCGRLVLKGETQQVDRILDEFSKRWCKCNPNHGFKVTDVVHTICYSILLLNTDLHLADIESKMTRSQFVKNTVPTVLHVLSDHPEDAFTDRLSILPSKSATEPLLFAPTLKDGEESKDVKGTSDTGPVSWRSSFKPPPKADNDGRAPTPLNYTAPLDDCGPLVKAPFHGTLRTWEVQIEIVLKDFYNSIRTERLPLFGAPIEKPQQPQQSQSNLTVFANNMLRRSPSVLSKAPSEAPSYARGRTADTVRLNTGKWTSKNRSRPRIYPASAMGSSRTSLDDQSMWSPSVSSSTWSKYSLGKTQTSMSVDSFGSSWPQGDYQQSIGFANALSQAIIREETIGSAGSNHSDELRVAPILEDESLELAGAPWAKEGLVKHKHHLESVDKKSKDRNWKETFAVIEKGYMSLFSFSSKSMRNKSKGKSAPGVVGGGNWQDNAENLGSFLLRQTIASALPSPGYSKQRPHVWALSLPTGAVHLFQVGTPEIVREFVSTANYWSARLSNHPLVGGISNIEYGWSDAIVNNALVLAINENLPPRPSTSAPRPSIQSSLRSSFDHVSSTGPGGFRSRLAGDRVIIADWTPPTQSMRASNLMEQDQLATLLAYVQGIEDELQKHNQLRNSMLLAFTPRHLNAQRAMANWEKKSSYLLREIVKFRTYIDCLQAAETMKQRIYSEREMERASREIEEVVRDGELDEEADSTLRVG